MANTGLTVSKREITGKKIRFLRRQGQTPVHLFGHGMESLALQCDTDALQDMINRKGTTRLLNINIGGEKGARSVFIREIQRDALTGLLLHVDLYQINKSEKIKVALPIIFKGTAPALKQKNNILEQIANELTVESLPDDLPPQIDIDLGVLTSSNQVITVRDLQLNPGVTIDANPDQIIVKISLIAEDKESTSSTASQADAGKGEPAAAENKGEKK
ncbi:MAG: 50S ribosomal protein L25 [Dehalococcoidia bacterium]|jgi:large subunit ribosomal protein L25|nr:50S ribosomal protein L25 [Dehalococcoidia bacterium]